MRSKFRIFIYDIENTFELIFKRKYSYLGYTYPNVPQPWVPIVNRLLKSMDEIVRPKWIPAIILNVINAFATGGSVVMVKNRFWNNVLSKITKGIRIFDIKDKYATLRVYGSFSDEIYALIDKAEKECENTCEKCGSQDNVFEYGHGWIYNVCEKCRVEMGGPVSYPDQDLLLSEDGGVITAENGEKIEKEQK
jgi:hypothetical protein